MNEKSPPRKNVSGRIALAIAAAVLFAIPAKLTARDPALPQTAAQEGSAAKQKTAVEAFKNLEVLKDIPSDQLIPSMRYMTAALGVGCDYCHEAEYFDSDDKPTKQRARNMMKMMLAINKDNFNGRREVTCYTCHRGSSKPASIPALPDPDAVASGGRTVALQDIRQAASTESNEAPANTTSGAVSALPDVDDIFAKYVQAIGGTAAIHKNGTRIEKGAVEGPHGLHATMETYRQAPNKAFAVLHSLNGDTTEGINGTIGWGRRPNGDVTEESGDELARSKQWAAFYPGADFKQDYSRFQVRGTEKIDGHDTYIVMAWWPAGGADRIYFDAQSGLLLRISHRIESPLGALPLQTDFDDYRDVSGMKIPFKVRVSRVNGPTTYTWQQMHANVPVDDAQFEKPVEKPATEKPAK